MQNLRTDSRGHIHQVGEGHGDVEQDEGVYAISPGGNLVLVRDVELKDGWRYATHEDLDAAANHAALLKAPTAPPPAEPAHGEQPHLDPPHA